MSSSVKIFFFLFLIPILVNETQSKPVFSRSLDMIQSLRNALLQQICSDGSINEQTTGRSNEVKTGKIPKEDIIEDILGLEDCCEFDDFKDIEMHDSKNREICSKEKIKCENIIKQLQSNISYLNETIGRIENNTKVIWLRLTQDCSKKDKIEKMILELNQTMIQNPNTTLESLREVLHNISSSTDSRLDGLATDLFSNLTTIKNQLDSKGKVLVNHAEFPVWVREEMMTEIQSGIKKEINILKEELRCQNSSESKICPPIKTKMIDSLTKSDFIAATAVITLIQFITFGTMIWYLNSKYNLSSAQKSDPNYDSISRARTIDTTSINSPYMEVGGIRPEPEYAMINKNRPCRSFSNESLEGNYDTHLSNHLNKL